MVSLFIKKKTVEIFPGEQPDSPVVFLNTFAGEGQKIACLLQKAGVDLSLAAISGLDWNANLSPWTASPLSSRDPPFAGGAADHLALLTEKILPETEKFLPGKPAWRGIAGYSLAGLFALYALYQTDIFTRAACMSSSFWFPGLLPYAVSHEMKRKPDCLYFSLGDNEHKTRHPLLRQVRPNTEQLYAHYQQQGIKTVLQYPPGNHFRNPEDRTASGIQWITEQ